MTGGTITGPKHCPAALLKERKPVYSETNWVVGSTLLRSINRPRRTDTMRSNTIDNTDVMEIGL